MRTPLLPKGGSCSNIVVLTSSLSFAQKAFFFFTKKIDFPKIKYKNLRYFNLGHAHRPKFGLFAITSSDFFFRGFLLPFHALSLSLPFASHILSGCRERLTLIMGKT